MMFVVLVMRYKLARTADKSGKHTQVECIVQRITDHKETSDKVEHRHTTRVLSINVLCLVCTESTEFLLWSWPLRKPFVKLNYSSHPCGIGSYANRLLRLISQVLCSEEECQTFGFAIFGGISALSDISVLND